MKVDNINCGICGLPVFPVESRHRSTFNRGDKVFCDSCKNGKCKYCGNPIKMSGGKMPQFCSKTCMGKAKTIPRVEKVCQSCGSRFVTDQAYRQNTQKTCSLKCKYALQVTHDPINRRLRRVLHNRIWGVFSREWGHKFGHKSVELTQCSVEFLRAWLESKMRRGMNWKNYGQRWHIDHIVPCAAFDLSDKAQALKCFHWSNLQPLEKRSNLIKHDSIDNAQLGLLMEVK